MIVWLLRREPIDQYAIPVSVWSTREQAIQAANAGDVEWCEDNRHPDVWFIKTCKGGLTEWVVEAVEYHPCT